MAKAKRAKLEAHGSESYVNPEKAKRTKAMKHGDAGFNNRIKAKQTCLERYGAENFACTEQYCSKRRANSIARHGVDDPN